MNNSILRFTLLVLITLSGFVDAGLEEQEKRESLTVVLSQIQQSHNIPALSVAVVDEGRLVYSENFGDVGTTAPRFRIASITKLFTAQAIMQLNEIGMVQLDDPVSRYLDQFDGMPTTIEDLMVHGSGLEDRLKPLSVDENRSFNDYLEGSLEENQPESNASFQYADINYNILGQIIQVALGAKYTEYVRTNIINKLGLKDTYFYHSGSDFIAPEVPYHNYGIVSKASPRPYDLSYAPSEGLISTASDVAVWVSAVMNEHPALLSLQSYRDMLIPRGKTSWGDLQIALGWQVLGEDFIQLAQHAGSMSGYKSLVITYPSRKRAIVVLANAEEVPRWGIAQVVNQVLEELPIAPPESSQAQYRLVLLTAGFIIIGFIGYVGWRRFRPKA